MDIAVPTVARDPWNKGKLVGQKAPFKPKDIWTLRVRLQIENRARELALFNLGLDSKLRACDLVALKVRDVCHGNQVASRAMVMQQKTHRPVQFEITATTRETLGKWIEVAGLKSENFLFPSRLHKSPHLGTRQYARILERWVEQWVLIQQSTAHTRCGAPRPRLFIAGRRTCVQFNYFLVTRSWSQPSATSALK
jgi:integrase